MTVKAARTRTSRNNIVMVDQDQFGALGKVTSTKSVGAQYTENISMSEKVLIESAAEKDRISEVQDREKLVGF